MIFHVVYFKTVIEFCMLINKFVMENIDAITVNIVIIVALHVAAILTLIKAPKKEENSAE